jgi:hypothetical protein
VKIDWLSLRHEASELRVSNAFGILSRLGVSAILIKGIAAARYHPDPSRRFSSDIDIAISPDEAVRAAEISKALTGMAVDLHVGFKHLDNKAWETVFYRGECFELNGIPVKAPRREDHFRILATHWLNDGGRRTEKLLDIFYCVDGAPEPFDWDICLEGIGPTRRNWLEKAVGALSRFEERTLRNHPFTRQEMELPAWFVETVEKEKSRDDAPLAYAKSFTEFLKAVRGKFPPNPIQATIEAEIPFGDSIPRVAQIESLFRRIGHSMRTYVLSK